MFASKILFAAPLIASVLASPTPIPSPAVPEAPISVRQEESDLGKRSTNSFHLVNCVTYSAVVVRLEGPQLNKVLRT
jgi:hypothetical protein